MVPTLLGTLVGAKTACCQHCLVPTLLVANTANSVPTLHVATHVDVHVAAPVASADYMHGNTLLEPTLLEPTLLGPTREHGDRVSDMYDSMRSDMFSDLRSTMPGHTCSDMYLLTAGGA